MWTYVVVALLLASLLAFVWVRQARHQRSATGRPTSRDDLLAQKGSHWGNVGY